MTFIGYLGYHDYEDFRERLMMDQDLRSSQMQLRLLHTDIDGMISSLYTRIPSQFLLMSYILILDSVLP